MARELGWSISGLRNPDDAAEVDCQLHGSACMGQNNTEAVLTTIIVTRTRVELLKRALRSLEAQDLVQVELVVLVDDCPLTRRFLETLPTPSGAVQSVRWIYAERGPYNHSGPKRLAALRNLGLQMVETQWCSYLDDDNELEPLHFSTLLELITRSNAPATHSWRSLWTQEGKPFFLRDRHPWCRNPDLAKTLFAQYQDTCIYQAGSNVVHDQVVPFCRHVSMVDMSEWLFETEFLRGIGFAGDYCTKDWETSRTEDSKFLDEIVMRGHRITSTQKPTLKYYLGGYSNDWSNEAAQLEGWL